MDDRRSIVELVIRFSDTLSFRSSDVLPRVACIIMPSLLHEGVIALVRDQPAFAASLLRELLNIEVPRFNEARLTEATLTQIVPVAYHADAVVLFVDFVGNKQPVFGAIFEVQLQPDDDKLFTWPLYAVAARARDRCPFVVLVVTPDPETARWARQPIELGGGNLFRPHVIGPEGIPQVTDRDQALREPQLAVLSVVAHGRSDDVPTVVAIGRAAINAVLPLPEAQRLLYSILIEKALSEAARKALDMEPQIEKFFTEAHRQSYDRGKAEGEAEGEAKGEAKGESKALMMILKQRGMTITNSQQRHILACTDLATLDRWLARALTVASVEELLA